jgi:hypothetical protein
MIKRLNSTAIRHGMHKQRSRVINNERTNQANMATCRKAPGLSANTLQAIKDGIFIKAQQGALSIAGTGAWNVSVQDMHSSWRCTAQRSLSCCYLALPLRQGLM